MWRIAILMGLGLVGCGGASSAYKGSVKLYASHTPEYARAITDCKKQEDGKYSEDCIVNWAFPMSGLQCTVDEDNAVKDSPACACTHATAAPERTTACTTWLELGS